MAPPTLLFRVGAHTYGCDIGATQEIIPLRPMTRLPGAPAFVRGLINMRGTIVTVLDLRARLDASRGPTPDGGSIVLVRHGDRLVGVIVEEVLDVRALTVVDDASAESGSAITRGVVALDGTTAVILDLDAIIAQVLLS